MQLVPAQKIFDMFSHHNIHTEALLKNHPDLQAYINDATVDYYAESVNPIVDTVNFINGEENTTYVHFHKALPFKKIEIACSKCDGIIRVNSNPSQIPIMVNHELSFRSEYNWYACVYEDILKINNFNSKVLAEIEIYILKFLEEETKLNRKIDKEYLSNSIKKLLPFT